MKRRLKGGLPFYRPTNGRTRSKQDCIDFHTNNWSIWIQCAPWELLAFICVSDCSFNHQQGGGEKNLFPATMFDR